MKIIKFILLICALSTFLIACTSPPPVTPEPLMYGIPRSQWLKLTSEQQDAIMQGYGGSDFTSSSTYNNFTASKKTSGNYVWPKKRTSLSAPPSQPVWHD